jgi:hypothetical protein
VSSPSVRWRKSDNGRGQLCCAATAAPAGAPRLRDCKPRFTGILRRGSIGVPIFEPDI